MASTGISTLPVEIFQEILKYCSQFQLAQLAQTSHSVLQHVIPFLYRTVDVSTHNRLAAEDPGPHYGILQCADSKPLRATPPQALRRQHSLLHALIHHPEYATYVREFTWTLLFVSDVGKPNPHELPPTLISYPETKIWDVFSLLTNVQKLDLASLHGYYVPYAAACPPTLFSSATSIRLLGWMSHALAVSILHSIDPTKLTHLALDDLQDWGQYTDGRPMSRDDGSRIRYRTESTHPDGSRGEVFPGPMRGLLPRLEGRCSSLTTLHLRMAGIENPYRSDYSVKADEQAYMEWAWFLNSVRPTLQHLSIEQGCVIPVPPPCSSGAGAPWRPMDHHLEVFVLPCLRSGPWEALRRVELRGVALRMAEARRIRKAMGDSGEVLLGWNSARPCDRFNGFVDTDLVPCDEDFSWRLREEGEEGEEGEKGDYWV